MQADTTSPLRTQLLARTPVGAGVALAALLLLVVPPAAHAQAQSADAPPLREVLRDQDGDRVPDRLGDTVEVVGIATTSPLLVGPTSSLLNIQDGGAGIVLFARDTTQLFQLAAGDMVRAWGEVGQFRGAEQLLVHRVERLRGARVPAPREVRVADLLGEQYSGRLVRVSGELIAFQEGDGRIFAELRDRTGQITINISGRHLSDPDFTQRLLRGGQAEVVGIASQRDAEPPYDSGYQLVPRGPEDFSLPLLPPYGGIAIVILVALLLTVLLLRRRTQRRVVEMERLAAELRRSHQALEESERRFRVLIEHGYDIITLLGRDGVILYESPSVERALGYRPEELVGRSAAELIHPDDVSAVIDALEAAFQEPGRTLSLQYRFRHRDGTWRWLESTGTSAPGDPTVQGAVVTSRDITQRKEAEARLEAYAEELRALSLTDPLTGLLNRRGFFTLAEHERRLAHRMGRPLLLLFMDVDDLKEINDSLGHAAGDRALLELSEVLKSTFRESDVVARVGGDEFTVLAWMDESGSAGAMTRRLEQAMREHAVRQQLPFTLAASLGMVEVAPTSDASLDELLDRADQKMYEAKRAQRDGR